MYGYAFAVVKNDDTLWINMARIMGNIKDFTGDLPQSALLKDGTLWSWDRTDFGPINKYIYSELPVKMMDEVKFISYRYVIKNDGTLWTIRGYHFENDPDSADYTPMQITENYKPIKVRF